MPSEVLHGCICITQTLQPLGLCWTLKITTAVVHKGELLDSTVHLCVEISHTLTFTIIFKTENTVGSTVKTWENVGLMWWHIRCSRGTTLGRICLCRLKVPLVSFVTMVNMSELESLLSGLILVYGKIREKVKWRWRNEFFLPHWHTSLKV